MAEKTGFGRRSFWKEALREIVGCAREVHQTLADIDIQEGFFDSEDSRYTLTRHYPRELFEAEAQRLGIEIDSVGMDEAVKQIFRARQKSGECS